MELDLDRGGYALGFLDMRFLLDATLVDYYPRGLGPVCSLLLGRTMHGNDCTSFAYFKTICRCDVMFFDFVALWI